MREDESQYGACRNESATY